MSVYEIASSTAKELGTVLHFIEHSPIGGGPMYSACITAQIHGIKAKKFVIYFYDNHARVHTRGQAAQDIAYYSDPQYLERLRKRIEYRIMQPRMPF